MIRLNGTYCSIDEAAQLIGITSGRLRQMVRNREIRAHNFGTRSWLIPLGEVQRVKDSPANTGRPRNGPTNGKHRLR